MSAVQGASQGPLPTFVEGVVGNDRAVLLGVVAVTTASWAWVIAMARDMYGPMTGASAWMMAVDWNAPRLLLLWAMWTAMMAGVTSLKSLLVAD